MTAIVGVLNSQGIAIAADSAVTVSGNNVKKVYNRSNKIFTLSKFHPVGIAIYNSADFMGIPLETLIKMYRKNLTDEAFDTVEEYKNDFIAFLKSQLKNVSKEYKVDSFYRFCSWAHMTIINNIIQALDEHETDIYSLEQDVRTPIFHDISNDILNKYSIKLDTFDKVSYMDVSFEDYCSQYNEELKTIKNYIEEEVNKEYDGFTLNDEHYEQIKNILYKLINIEFIFENYCGLVFIGFGETEIYPSSHHVLVGTSIIDNTRIRMMDVIKINPGVLNSLCSG
ncbi:hypothetical protein GR160_08645 [Flavobacterium sp. Sd200]|uniref:hypothetical protein n=1 Tax=Flavobacterium sp. Sd200 TaxID=2692211 RepID=UPI00136FC524|nr:hypothetical protein [Flavobacterium sp. Sd200]MXN91296.1 hypothetical protein [Flavobacterium sp. Sd200]